jgi:hypothetical protein
MSSEVLTTANRIARATGLACPMVRPVNLDDLPAEQMEIARQLPDEVAYQLSTLEQP